MPQIQLHKILMSVLVFLVLLAAPAFSSVLACPGFGWLGRPAKAFQQEEQPAKKDTKKSSERPGSEGGTAGKTPPKENKKTAPKLGRSPPACRHRSHRCQCPSRCWSRQASS